MRVVLRPVVNSGKVVPFFFKIEPPRASDMALKDLERWAPGNEEWVIIRARDLEALARHVKEWRVTYAEAEKIAAGAK